MKEGLGITADETREGVPVAMIPAGGQHLYEHCTAAISEGLCPAHTSALRDSGWCPDCSGWWCTYGDGLAQRVSFTCPVPELGAYPEP